MKMEQTNNCHTPRVKTPPLPPDTVPLKTQVSGHFYGTRTTKLGMLELKDGTIIKPLIPPKGDNELVFYKTVFDMGENGSRVNGSSEIEALRPNLAQYYGVWTTPLHPGVEYMRLENITRRFKKPCVLDVKVGPITWGPFAPEDRKGREIQKYPQQSQVGFRLLGIKRYTPSTDSYMNLDQKFMRTLQVEDILPKGILAYLDHKENVMYKKGITQAMIARLENIQAWFTVQKIYHFYASSLLFIYEGQPDLSSHDNTSDIDYSKYIDLRLIDFTHVCPAQGARDDNFLTGINKLLHHFRAALEHCS